MKLGEMQRYDICPHCYIADELKSANGDFVRFSDAQSKSLADERRIAELESALRDAIQLVLEVEEGMTVKEITRLNALRDALRVETK